MSTVLDPVTTTATTAVPSAGHESPVRSGRRSTWALWGAAAAVAGLAGTMLTINPSFDDYSNVDQVIAKLDSTTYHIGLVAGFVAVFCTLFTAAGWRRWASDHAPRSLAARVIPMALTASAGAMMLAYGIKGTLGDYLPGGGEGSFHWANSGLYALFMWLDFAPFIAWWGACMASAAVAWVALRERRLPRWIGALSLLAFAFPTTVMFLTSVPGIPALSILWLLVISLAMAVRRES